MSRGFYSSDTLRFCAFEAPLSIHVNPNRQAALLVALLLFGAALRLYGLDEKIIWHDEVATRVLSGGATASTTLAGLFEPPAIVGGHDRLATHRALATTLRSPGNNNQRQPILVLNFPQL